MRLDDFLDALRAFDWREMESFVSDALNAMQQFGGVQQNVVENGRQYDIVATEADSLTSKPARWFFEVKARRNRVGVDEVQQLAELSTVTAHSSPGARFCLALNIPPTAYARSVAAQAGIEVWGPAELLRVVPDEVLRKYFGVPSGEVADDDRSRAKGAALIESMSKTRPGRTDWRQYQQLMSEVLEFLFCPPLAQPLDEVPDADRRNRRDMILENAAPEGFWHRLRETYEAHYVVADAKNYVSPIGKTPVLDVAHYLKPHGCGMFGLILSRNGAGGAAAHALREQWVAARKMIIVLSDRDIEEMVNLKVEAGDPEVLLRRRIAEFRISL